jgi:hypothetical protein
MQMLSVQSAYQFSNNSSMKLEGAYSNNNKNTFSTLDKFNDDGIGLFFSTQQKQIKEQDKYFRDYKYKRVIDTAFALPIDLDEVKNDELKKAQKLDWIKRYMKDAGLDESIQILYDWSERK